MRIIRTTLVSLLALTWVLLTSHCRIEAMPGFDFFPCTADVHPVDSAGDEGEPCNEAGCCSIESEQYHSPRQNEIGPLLVVAIVPADHYGVGGQSLPKEASPGILTAAPPELPTSWQFLSRTALPPRAPSRAS